MKVEIGGVVYETRPAADKTKNVSTFISHTAGMTYYYSGHNGSSKKSMYMETEELIREFELVQKKQSPHSRRKRDNIEYMFHKTFMKV